MTMHWFLLATLATAFARHSNATSTRDCDIPKPGYDPAKDPDLLPDSVTFQLENSTFVRETNGCNGFLGYCNKTIGQVLWIGAHNSLTDVGLVLQRNQFVDGPRLLDAGIRYFDIDTCAFVKKGARQSPMVCHGYVWWRTQVYQETKTGLQLIRAWMDKNPREVIFLNFGDIADFTALNAQGEATSTAQIRAELVSTVRSVFGSMVVLRNDPWDAEISTNKATLNDLIGANRRVIVNIGKGTSNELSHWGQDDKVCNDVWYPDSLKADFLHNNYEWKPVIDHIDANMRRPCAQSPKLLNKLEFQFHTALGGTIDSSHVGETLAAYLSSLKTQNNQLHVAPFFPFNLILTDHSDKWSAYYPQWHADHLQYLNA